MGDHDFANSFHLRISLSPGNETSVTFFHSNDPNGPSSNRRVVDGAQVDNTDLWIGVLNAPVDDDVRIYEMAGDVGIMGPVVYQVGNSVSGQLGESKTTDFAVGRNVLDRYGNTALNSSRFHYAGFTDDTGLGDLTGSNQAEANLIADETFFQEYDSGAPSLYVSEGKLELLGIHSFIAEISTAPPHSTMERRFSGDVYLPIYEDEIEATKALLVPEPQSVVLIAIGILALAFQIRKSVN